MKTFLLTWNPRRWPVAEVAADARRFAARRLREKSWSIGGRRRGVEAGDRLFLLRQSVEPKGLIASGWAVGPIYWADHWDAAKRPAKTTYVDFELEALLRPEEDAPLGLQRLRRSVPTGVNWAAQSSGTAVEPAAAARIERLWVRHLAGLGIEPRPRRPPRLPAHPPADELEALEGVEKRRMVRHLHRERWLRDAKIHDTLCRRGGRLRCEVPGCGFDFESAYGALGQGYAQVHHLRPLSDRAAPTRTKLEDLAIVCANCHAMIHRNGQCRSLRAVRPRGRR